MSEIQELPEEGTGTLSEIPPATDEALASQGEPPEASYRPRRPERRPPSFFWPLIFIGAGVILLLANLGYLPWQSWNMLWRLWPLLLVALGIDLLIGRRSMLGAVLSALLILLLIAGVAVIALFAQNIPPMVEAAGSAELRTEHVQYRRLAWNAPRSASTGTAAPTPWARWVTRPILSKATLRIAAG